MIFYLYFMFLVNLLMVAGSLGMATLMIYCFIWGGGWIAFGIVILLILLPLMIFATYMIISTSLEIAKDELQEYRQNHPKKVKKSKVKEIE